ncbi:MAG: hypothetical protein H6678_07740 [Candidatus Delongbacteria bacterium]|nr:hypothetical protein [Candidatus Delongbacteria bacterium]
MSSLPRTVSILLLLALGLLSTVAAMVELTPVLTLNPGESSRFTNASLGLSPTSTLSATGPALDHVSMTATPGSLELACDAPFGWQVLESKDGDVLLRSGGRVPVDFVHDGEPGQNVFVFGSFNGWNRGANTLEELTPGHYSTRVALESGDYEYLFKVGDRELLDPSNPDSVSNGMGGFNSPLKVRAAQGSTIHVRRLGWRAVAEGRCVSFLCEGQGSAPRVSALHGNRRVEATAVSFVGDTLRVTIASSPRMGPDILRLALSGPGSASSLQTIWFDRDFVWEDGLVYALMPDRFRNGDPDNDRPVSHPELSERANWQGGDLAGILKCLQEGYFSNLGVNTLWIYPLNLAADGAWREFPEPHRMYTGYHGYWPVSDRKLEPRFGDEELFKQVVAEAHRRGIKVLLDFVSNHVHEDHPWVRQHPDWFSQLALPDGTLNLRNWDEHRLTTWFEPYMPDIDYSHSPQVTQAMCDAALWWLKTYDLDGFRHDAVKHVPREFWEELTRRIRKDPVLSGRDIFQIGETFGSDELILSYVGPDVLDAQFNFNLFHPARALFLNEQANFGGLADLVTQDLRIYGANNRMGMLMDSHDKARYAVYADGDMPLEGVSETEPGWHNEYRVDHPETYDKQALYLTWMLTSPGLPFLYYGDEIGMTGAGDPDNRRMMRFGKDVSEDEARLKERVSLLCRARRERPELRRGDLEFLLADEQVVAYLRSAENADGSPSRSLIWLNRSGSLQTRSVNLPLGLGAREVELQPWGGSIQIIE